MKIDDFNWDNPPESFTITSYLRYQKKEIPINENISKTEYRLQQMWQGDRGSQKWEWVEYED